MSFPAARLTDMTMHGGVVTPPGLPLVLIGGMPAARMGDMHACPFVTVLVPHATGPVVLGSFNVLVGGQPQARMTDMCVCVGPPSMISLGSFNTLVGMAGALDACLGGALGAIIGGVLASAGNLAPPMPRMPDLPGSGAAGQGGVPGVPKKGWV